MGKNYWMFVESSEHFETTRGLGFTLFGVGPKYRRRAERMQPDDRVLFYVTGFKKWPATATIVSGYFEDDTPLWNAVGKSADHRYRVKLRPDLVLDEEDFIDALILAPRLEYVKRWPPEDWPLAFFERVHLLPQRDFRLVESEMKRITSKKRRQRRHHERRNAIEPSETRAQPQPVEASLAQAESGEASETRPESPYASKDYPAGDGSGEGSR